MLPLRWHRREPADYRISSRGSGYGNRENFFRRVYKKSKFPGFSRICGRGCIVYCIVLETARAAGNTQRVRKQEMFKKNNGKIMGNNGDGPIFITSR